MSKQHPSPEPPRLLSEPWPAGQIQLLGCVRHQTSVFAKGICSQETSLRGPLWSLMCCWSEPTHSHWDALWEMFSLSHVPSPSLHLNPLFLPLPLSPSSSPSLISLSLSLCASLALFTASTLLSFLPLWLFAPLLSLSSNPPSHFSNPPEHLHCNTLSVSHTPRGGVQLVHYVSWVFLRLMENTQNASAFHHSTGKRETLSPHIASVRESFYRQAAAGSSFSSLFSLTGSCSVGPLRTGSGSGWFNDICAINVNKSAEIHDFLSNSCCGEDIKKLIFSVFRSGWAESYFKKWWCRNTPWHINWRYD